MQTASESSEDWRIRVDIVSLQTKGDTEKRWGAVRAALQTAAGRTHTAAGRVRSGVQTAES